MNPSPKSPPAATDGIAALLRRAHDGTAQAVRALGAPAELAEAVADGAGLMIDGWFATVTLLPVRQADGSDAAPVLVTLNTGRVMADIAGEEWQGLLALAPTLLAHQAAVGFTPEGWLCLYRLVPPARVDAAGIEEALRDAWRLARLVWQAPAAPGVQA